MARKLLIFAIFVLCSLSGSCRDSATAAVEPGPEQNVAGNAKIEITRPEPVAVSPTQTGKDKKMNEDPLTQVKMNAKAEITGDKLKVSYEVHNLTDSDVYLWDGMIGFDGPEKVVNNDRAYVYYEEPNTVRMIRADLPSPTTFKIGVKQILFARLLKARSKLNIDFSVPYPLEEHSPYYERPTEEDKELKECTRIRLLVGWTPPRTGMTIEERDIQGAKWYKIRGFWASPYQEILEQTIPLDVELFVYKSDFERQMPLR